MIGFDGQSEQEVLKAVQDIDDWVSKGLDKQFSGVAAGNTDLRNDALFKLWFEQKIDPGATPPGNPNWLLGLEFVEGGGDEVRHYMRVSGVVGHGVTWKQFASELALKYTEKAWALAGQPMPALSPQRPMGGTNASS